MPEKKMTKKKVLKNTPQKERHFGVILEDISYQDIRKELRSMEREISDLRSRLNKEPEFSRLENLAERVKNLKYFSKKLANAG